VWIAPSILAADFACLADEIRRVEAAGAELLHIDVMDGHFVPNLTIGPPVVESLRRVSRLPFDVHLMLAHPERFIAPFADAGADHITVHVEVETDMDRLLGDIRAAGCSAGLSLRPRTPVAALAPYLAQVTMVLVMTVEPGFGGQSFLADTLPKVRELRRRFDAGAGPRLLEVDGGIAPATAAGVISAGANVLVAGTAVFRAPGGAAAAMAHLRAAGG
jgi:ribulose-phosphate 3-epimerase